MTYPRSVFDFAGRRGDLETVHAIEPPQIVRGMLRVGGFERPDWAQFPNDDLAVLEPIFDRFTAFDYGIGRKHPVFDGDLSVMRLGRSICGIGRAFGSERPGVRAG